jgi:hypothetical protein
MLACRLVFVTCHYNMPKKLMVGSRELLHVVQDIKPFGQGRKNTTNSDYGALHFVQLEHLFVHKQYVTIFCSSISRWNVTPMVAWPPRPLI